MTLVAIEMRRGLARRSTRVLVALAVTLIAAMGIGVFLSSRATFDVQSGRAEATRERDGYINDCVGSNGFGGEVHRQPGEDLQQSCEKSTGPVEDFVRDRRHKLTVLWPGGGDDGDSVLGVTAIFLVIGALMAGATFIGGDWRFGTIATLLTWEPRRLRVFFAKATAVAVLSFIIGFLLQALVGLALLPSAVWRGTTEGADSEWFRGVVGVTLRASALGAGAALVGYAIATLGRNTAAALGVAFGYVAIVEALIRGLKPEWQRWLIGDNSTVLLFGRQLRAATFERTLTEASVILVTYLVVVLAAAALTFSRRDVAA